MTRTYKAQRAVEQTTVVAKPSRAIQFPQVLTTSGLPARDDFQKRTDVVAGCICSLLKTWEEAVQQHEWRNTPSINKLAEGTSAELNIMPYCLLLRLALLRWMQRQTSSSNAQVLMHLLLSPKACCSQPLFAPVDVGSVVRLRSSAVWRNRWLIWHALPQRAD